MRGGGGSVAPLTNGVQDSPAVKTLPPRALRALRTPTTRAAMAALVYTRHAHAAVTANNKSAS